MEAVTPVYRLSGSMTPSQDQGDNSSHLSFELSLKDHGGFISNFSNDNDTKHLTDLVSVSHQQLSQRYCMKISCFILGLPAMIIAQIRNMFAIIRSGGQVMIPQFLRRRCRIRHCICTVQVGPTIIVNPPVMNPLPFPTIAPIPPPVTDETASPDFTTPTTETAELTEAPSDTTLTTEIENTESTITPTDLTDLTTLTEGQPGVSDVTTDMPLTTEGSITTDNTDNTTPVDISTTFTATETSSETESSITTEIDLVTTETTELPIQPTDENDALPTLSPQTELPTLFPQSEPPTLFPQTELPTLSPQSESYFTFTEPIFDETSTIPATTENFTQNIPDSVNITDLPEASNSSDPILGSLTSALSFSIETIIIIVVVISLAGLLTGCLLWKLFQKRKKTTVHPKRVQVSL